MEYYANFREIKAESILSLYDLGDFALEMNGIFHRNYSSDLMSKLSNKEEIELSRDSVYHLLPEGLFFNEEELLNSEILREKKKKRKFFFQLFDTEYFKLSLKLEQEINNISEKQVRNLKDHSINRDIEPKTEEDMLNILNHSDFVCEIRGKEWLIVDILKMILDIKKIELIKIEDFNSPEIIRKRFIIHIPNLSVEEYFQKNHQISKMFEILKEYFLPFDIEYDFKIKDRKHKFILSQNLILDYNTNI